MSEAIRLGAVMVLYNKTIDQSATYNTLLEGLETPVLVYDNSPQEQKFELQETVEYKHNPNNPGVSKAYNEAAIWAKEKGCTHLLLLDSDSSFPKNAIKVYQDELLKDSKTIVLPAMISAQRKISPFYFKYGKSWYGDNIPFGPILLGKTLAINSGMLVPMNLLEEVNGFNENLPLDWSDVFFVRKLSKIKAKAVHVSLKVDHGLSEHEEPNIESAKFRFGIQLKGIKIVSKHFGERMLMLFWMKMKMLKLGFRYRSLWFILHFVRNFYA